MRISKSFFKTYRDAPNDAEINSHKLLVRAGYIKKQSAGIYIYLPLGLRVLDKIKRVVAEEMDAIGAVQVQMPMLLNQEVYESRLKNFGSEMFRLKDGSGKDFCLGPTHEEVFTQVVKDNITSYKQLPISLYQINTKFRDEIRPRFGLQRAKEFLMKDAYSFDKDEAGLNESYENMRKAYCKVFERLGLDYVAVYADCGYMGGNGSQEFMVKSNVGEDEITVCDACNYAANLEKAECVYNGAESMEEGGKFEEVVTPEVKTIKELTDFFGVEETNFVKAVVYDTDKGVVVALVRGDREVEEKKLINAIKTIKLEMATPEQIEAIGSVAGFVGAKGLKNAYVIADEEIKGMVNFVSGANKYNVHFKNMNVKDLEVNEYRDIRKVVDGDLCPDCGKPMRIIRGIEVGHIFKLGTHYTKIMDCTYLDENGKKQYMIMGCYGIGISRTLSAVVEQCSDDKGIIWPEVIAPYKVEILTANQKDMAQVEVADSLYDYFNEN
ncbi:MAG: proline--tRNA ligase, partial [Clostridia bacterium]|nr:proline--tRNA ligase [Clostridia bacterium]